MKYNYIKHYYLWCKYILYLQNNNILTYNTIDNLKIAKHNNIKHLNTSLIPTYLYNKNYKNISNLILVWNNLDDLLKFNIKCLAVSINGILINQKDLLLINKNKEVQMLINCLANTYCNLQLYINNIIINLINIINNIKIN